MGSIENVGSTQTHEHRVEGFAIEATAQKSGNNQASTQFEADNVPITQKCPQVC